MPVYFNSGAGAERRRGAPIAGQSPPTAGRGGRAGANGQNTTPMATPLKLSAWDPDHTGTAYGVATSIGNDFNVAQAGSRPAVAAVAAAAGAGGGFGGGGGGAPASGRRASPPTRIRRRAS